MPTDPIQQNTGSFIPTTGTRDQTQSGEQLILALRENINTVALALNTKDSGYYARTEFINGQVWYPDPTLTSQSTQTPELRQDFRIVVVMPALPNNGTISIPHGITVDNKLMWTRIYGTATDPVGLTGLSLPYSSTIDVAHNVELWPDALNVNIRTGINRSAFTKVVVVLEYLKN